MNASKNPSQDSNKTLLETFSSWILDNLHKDSDNDWIPNNEDKTNSDKNLLSNLSEINENIDHIFTWVDNVVQWLSCWFGWWGCIATPLNWAPLAPWGDPTLFGAPIWDGLKVNEWIPVFSALTWIPPTWVTPPIPTVWPVSPLWDAGVGYWLWAWWYLGTESSSNFFRLFVTPTLT